MEDRVEGFRSQAEGLGLQEARLWATSARRAGEIGASAASRSCGASSVRIPVAMPVHPNADRCLSLDVQPSTLFLSTVTFSLQPLAFNP